MMLVLIVRFPHLNTYSFELEMTRQQVSGVLSSTYTVSPECVRPECYLTIFVIDAGFPVEPSLFLRWFR